MFNLEGHCKLVCANETTEIDQQVASEAVGKN